jgi:sarcosine oxidase
VATEYDVIVAGVGGVGASACWHLAKRGLRVLGLEQFDIPHAQGSSHGLTRIIRLAYHESPAYVPLVRRAMELWREAGQRFGEQLMFTTGSLDAGADGGEFFNGALASCKEHGLRHQILSAAELNRRFPGLTLPEGHRGLFQPDGGFVLSERGIIAHVTLAQAAGAEIHAREPILNWSYRSGGDVTVTTTRGEYRGARIVLAVGSWLRDLAPAFGLATIPERQVIGWFQPAHPKLYEPSAFPVTILAVEEGSYYLLPTWGMPGVKIGLHHHRQEQGHPDDLRREPDAEDEALLRRCLARYAPDGNGPTMALKTCLYTNTPDEHFTIGTLGADNVIVASPCSGHGYKFVTVVGELLADLATGRKPAFDLAMFAPDRFRNRAIQ